jgi:membrane-associated phospholipid phosphatase
LIPVGWARVELKAHSPSQFMAAVLVTIVTTWLQLKVYVPLF